MPRPEWLRWQPIRFSPWLWITMFVSALPPIGYLLVRDWPLWSSPSQDNLPRMAREWYALPRMPVIIVYTIAAQLILIWFTYFSGNPRVQKHDKFSVLLMSAGAAIGWLLIILDATNGITAKLLPN